MAVVRQKGRRCIRDVAPEPTGCGTLDGTLRHGRVYPLRGYTVEAASDFRHLMVALAAADGFDVVFALNIETAAALARDLAGSGSLLEEGQLILRN
jgi:hypothetical protein